MPRPESPSAVPHIIDVTTASFTDAVVEQSHRVPVLVDFWATWCGPCRALGPILEKLAAEFDGAFVLARIDTDQEQALAAQFQIRSIPTVMLFRDGRSVAAFPGALPEGQIRRFLAEHGVEAGTPTPVTLAADPAERVAQLQTLLAHQPERASMRLELAVALADAGRDEEARRALEALPTAVYGQARAVRARARLTLSALAAARPAGDATREGIETLLRGDAAAGIASLLDALREQKGDDDSPARAALVEAFNALEDETLVRDARRRMAAVLF